MVAYLGHGMMSLCLISSVSNYTWNRQCPNHGLAYLRPSITPRNNKCVTQVLMEESWDKVNIKSDIIHDTNLRVQTTFAR